jgi:hypothetical protein
MLYFKHYLFLTTGLATALILRNPASTDSLGVFGRSSISALDGVHALAASDGKREDDQPTTEARVVMVPLIHRDSNDLASAQFTSPDDKRKFVVGLASQIVTSAYWAFDIWFTQREGNTIYRGGRYSSSLKEYKVIIPAVRTIYTSNTQYRGALDFVLQGSSGTTEVVIKFTAEVFASAASFIVQSMINPPTATIGGVPVGITSWSFDPPKP